VEQQKLSGVTGYFNFADVADMQVIGQIADWHYSPRKSCYQNIITSKFTEVFIMNRNISGLLIFTASVIVLSCTNPVGSDEESDLSFQEEYYIVNSDTFTVYRSPDIIAVYLSPEADLEELNQLVQSNNLQPLRPFTHEPYDVIMNLQAHSHMPVILRLPKNTDRSQFYSFSKDLTGECFAKNLLVAFSLPAYRMDMDNDHWFYPNNQIMVKPEDADFSYSDLESSFNLTYVSTNELINTYRFEDNAFAHGSPYELSRAVFYSGSYRYVVPNGYMHISRW
jgi:hypothetical protein